MGRSKLENWISEVALCFDGDECLIWPFYRNPQGYGMITRYGRPHIASRVVCVAKHGPPPAKHYQAAHSCNNGSGGCVNPKHLVWKTPAENQADRKLAGTDNSGSRHGKSKLTDEQVRMIKRHTDVSARELAFRFGVSRWTIFDIRSGRRWGHIYP